MTRDEYEASARRYSDAVRLILRLSSGRYALFNNSRHLLMIGTLEEVCQHPAVTTYVQPRGAPAPPVRPDMAHLVEDLDL